jgi:hypothetical protein
MGRSDSEGEAVSSNEYDDDLADPSAVVAGAWDEGPYGRGDALGTYNEVDSNTMARALSMLDLSQPVRSFSLGETLFVGFPAFGSRRYEQKLAVMGNDPGEGFAGEILSTEPSGPNDMTSLEERVQLTFNMGSKINGLAHAGVGEVYYGGRRIDDLIRDDGVADLDTTGWGDPLVTRGLLIDILGLKVAEGADDALGRTDDGRPHLHGRYRVSLADLDAAIERQGLPELEPGDAIFVRTGWGRLVRTDPRGFLRGSPGVWLSETRWLASHRPALLGTDSWCWGTTAPEVADGAYGACHQELLARNGIRIGEGIRLEDLADAGVDRFVLVHNPVRADGAVSTISPATALANVSS